MNNKKALFIFTEQGSIPASPNKPTGFDLQECAEPYAELSKAGVRVDFATVHGMAAPVDPASVKRSKDSASTQFMQQFMRNNTLACQQLSSLPLETYDLIYFPGGHGPMFDLAKDDQMALLVSKWFEQGRHKVLSAICHGPAAMIGMKVGQKPLLDGHQVCCFTDNEERKFASVDIERELPFLLETRLRQLGAKTVSADVMAECVVSSPAANGNLIVTGQNPASAKALGMNLVASLRVKA